MSSPEYYYRRSHPRGHSHSHSHSHRHSHPHPGPSTRRDSHVSHTHQDPQPRRQTYERRDERYDRDYGYDEYIKDPPPMKHLREPRVAGERTHRVHHVERTYDAPPAYGTTSNVQQPKYTAQPRVEPVQYWVPREEIMKRESYGPEPHYTIDKGKGSQIQEWVDKTW